MSCTKKYLAGSSNDIITKGNSARSKLLLTTSAAALAMVASVSPTLANAQDESPDQRDSSRDSYDQSTVLLEEIVVTSTKRAQQATDIPYNITAVTGETIERLGVSDISDLSRIAPGIAVVDSGARTGFISSSVVIRGLNVDDTGRIHSPLKNVPTISIYVNDTPLFANLRLMDIERIEVLRGPQGTLYGSGSVGGNIRYVLNAPSVSDGFNGQVSAGLSFTENASGMNHEESLIVNLPVSDHFALRFNASYEQEQGFLDFNNLYAREDNSTFNANALPVLADPADIVQSAPVIAPVEENADDSEAIFIRAAARYENDHIDATLNYFHQEQNADSTPVYQARNADDEFVSSSRTLMPFESSVDLASLEITADFGFASFNSITSYSDSDSRGLFDQTDLYVNFDFYPDYYGNSPRPIVVDNSERHEEVLTQEVRLTSPGAQTIDWLVGAFYQKLDGETVTRQFFPGYDDFANACLNDPMTGGVGRTDCGFGTLFGVQGDNGGVPITAEVRDLAYFSDFQDSFENLAFFGEVTWNITDRLQITGGARWFDQKYEIAEQGGLFFVPDFVANTRANFDASDIIFKVNSSWEYADGHQIYATWSEGFRRGGANALGPLGTPDTATYDPDTIDNLEVGLKGVFSGRVSYTVGYFNINWDSIQLRSDCTDLALICTVTAGNASLSGIEMEVNAFLTDSLRVNAGYTYLDTALDTPQGFLVGQTTPGRRLPGSAENTFNITALYDHELQNDWNIGATASLAYVGERTTAIQDALSETLDGAVEVDVSVSLYNENWTFRVFADNLFNEDARLSQFPTRPEAGNSGYADGLAPAIARRPRTIGVTGTYRF